MATTQVCPVCKCFGPADPFKIIDDYTYFACPTCESLYIQQDVLAAMDRGESPWQYEQSYWDGELSSARDRAKADGLVRSGETILYTRRPVRRFLDVGAGPGFLLDELIRQFPQYADIFHAVELFPPAVHSDHPHYVIGSVADLSDKFDAGVCIEVIEHLTPTMLETLVSGLAQVAETDSAWLFNSGSPGYVRHEDPDYLDPRRRGHIVSYGLNGLKTIFEPHGFRILPLPGKSYAFLAEYRPTASPIPFHERYYYPIPENRELLKSSGLLYIAAFEAARAHHLYEDVQILQQRVAASNPQIRRSMLSPLRRLAHRVIHTR